MSEKVIIQVVSMAVAGLIASVSALTAGFADGNVVSKAVESLARQPEAKQSIFSTMLIGCGLIEATPIIALVVALLLLFANPFLAN